MDGVSAIDARVPDRGSWLFYSKNTPRDARHAR